jgi:hypothetical protein
MATPSQSAIRNHLKFVNMYLITSTKKVNVKFNPRPPEDQEFYRLFSSVKNEQFEVAFLEVKKNGELTNILPYFVMNFHLNIMLPDGLIKKMTSWLAMKVAFVGHPSIDRGYIHGDLNLNLLEQVNSKLISYAPLICYKGFDSNLPLPNFTMVKGLPNTVLNISQNYWATLRSTAKSNLKKKLRLSKDLQFLETNGLPAEYVDKVYSLYENTLNKSAVKFEFLQKNYFINTGPISKYIYYFDKKEMIGFAQLLCSEQSMYFKYCGMDYKKSLRFQVYFSLILQMLNICIRDGIKELDFGPTTYHFKNYVGALNYPTFNYFYHSNPLINWLLKRVKFAFEPSNDELK